MIVMLGYAIAVTKYLNGEVMLISANNELSPPVARTGIQGISAIYIELNCIL